MTLSEWEDSPGPGDHFTKTSNLEDPKLPMNRTGDCVMARHFLPGTGQSWILLPCDEPVDMAVVCEPIPEVVPNPGALAFTLDYASPTCQIGWILLNETCVQFPPVEGAADKLTCTRMSSTNMSMEFRYYSDLFRSNQNSQGEYLGDNRYEYREDTCISYLGMSLDSPYMINVCTQTPTLITWTVSPAFHRCSSSGEHLSMTHVCDGDADCPGKEDEVGCSHVCTTPDRQGELVCE